ncbi:probable protein phosphatase 2C 47 [Rutidosis leptorrhynchoides]|uniref:probable protein phosphatase 2C 47 n=1 Tax=Rutidosis leptorrhynchoides TaxID=125765 RepID=UPI003A990914
MAGFDFRSETRWWVSFSDLAFRSNGIAINTVRFDASDNKLGVRGRWLRSAHDENREDEQLIEPYLSTNSASIKNGNVGSKFSRCIRSGSHTDVGGRRQNEDEHIQIDDLSMLLGDKYKRLHASSFYAIFDGHGGSEAASYVKDYTMKLFLDESNLPQAELVDDTLLKELQDYHRKAFLQADKALADDRSISDYCGTTALSVLILYNRYLILANAGDSRAVVSRKGVAIQMSNDHRPSYLQEKERVEKLGGYFEDGYLNGELGVTRALGDWYMKSPNGLGSVLIAEPEMRHMELSEDDEFMIIGCDGIWIVMSNEEAVRIVRRGLLKNNDPQQCVMEIINEALGRHAIDNLTAIVVCFTSHIEPPKAWRPKFRRAL